MEPSDLIPPTADRKKILVVDDSQTTREMVAHALKKAGYTVVVANDGVSALAMVTNFLPDIVIADWMMPGMNGNDLCGSLRSLTTGNYIYIVLMTAATSEIDLTTALRAGADEFLGKPINLKELVLRLEAAVRLLDVERRLRVQASQDSLTGLLNRNSFSNILESEHARCLRYGCELSLLMIDIDHFKTVNDTYGHQAGDMVLQQVARLLKSNVRLSDHVNRFGGDEFCVLFTNTHREDALTCAERLRSEVARLTIEFDGRPIHFTASFGLAECDITTFSPTDLVERADQALFHGKRNGRNSVGVWTKTEHASELLSTIGEVSE